MKPPYFSNFSVSCVAIAVFALLLAIGCTDQHLPSSEPTQGAPLRFQVTFALSQGSGFDMPIDTETLKVLVGPLDIDEAEEHEILLREVPAHVELDPSQSIYDRELEGYTRATFHITLLDPLSTPGVNVARFRVFDRAGNENERSIVYWTVKPRH